MTQKIRTRLQSAAPKPRYRVTNWPAYNRALVERGSVTLWLSDEVIQGWRAGGGKGCVYSDLAIRCALSLRAVFRLTQRPGAGVSGEPRKQASAGSAGAALFHAEPPGGGAGHTGSDPQAGPCSSGDR